MSQVALDNNKNAVLRDGVFVGLLPWDDTL